MSRVVLCAPLPFPASVLPERLAATDWSALLSLHDDVFEGADFKMRLESTPPDPQMVDSFAAAADRVRPSLTGDELAAIGGHQSVVYVASDHATTDDAALAAAQRAQLLVVALIDAGALGVKIESAGLAHGRQRWRELLEQTRDAMVRRRQGDEDAAYDFFWGLIDSFVRRPIRDADGLLYSCGMHLLGRPDVAVHESAVASPEAGVELLDALAMYQCAEAEPGALADGHTFRPSDEWPRYVLHHQPDLVHPEDDLFFNPWGRWRVDPA